MPVAGGIGRSQRATEPGHLKTRRPGAHRDPVGIEAGDEVKATAVLGLVRVAHPARDLQPLDRGESQVRVGGLRFAVRRALVELEVGEVGVVVEGNPQEHVLVLMEVVESGRPREALGAVGRGEAQFVAVHLRSGIPDEGAVVPPVPLGHVGLRQRRSRRRETAPLYDDVVFPREGVVTRGRVIRHVVKIAIAGDVLRVQEAGSVGGVQREAPVTRILGGVESDHVDLAWVAHVVEIYARRGGVEEIDAARAGTFRAQVVPGEKHRQPLNRLQQQVCAPADIVLRLPPA